VVDDNSGGLTGRQVLAGSMRAQAGRIAAASALFVGHQSGEAAVPLLIGVVIDQAIAPGRAQALLLWLGVLAATFATLSLCWRFGMRIGTQAGVRADRELRLAVAARVLDDRGTSGTRVLPGATVSIATADVRRTALVNLRIPHGIAAAAGAVVASVALVVVSLPLGLLIMVGVPALLVLVRVVSAPLERRSSAQQERAAQAAGVATDLVRGIRVLKGIGAERAGTARYRATSRLSLAASLHTTRAEAGYSAAVIALTGLFLAIVALVGGRLAAAGTITVGQLVSSVGLAQFLLGPVGAFGEIMAALAAGRASAARVARLLSAPFAVTNGSGTPAVGRVAGRVEVAGVHGTGLLGVDLHAAPGELVAVLTTDPAAADALVDLFGRATDPEAGVLTLDGIPYAEHDLAALRRAVLVSPHDPDLFTGTVEENVRAAGPDEGAGELGAVLAVATVDQVAATLPDGLDTAVAERGRSLSGGQRQRIALARALLRDPDVLVLHDPTTAVDSVTEAAVAAGLRKLRGDRTTILLTTSPALLAEADRVVFVDGGRVAATGPHADLMREQPGYRTTVLA
jgi:putative ABC transport system ATP-binding protein